MKRIYQIKNRVTGDCYIGSAVDIIDRLKYHRKALEQNLYLTSKDRKPYLQNAWNKYREEALEFSILEELPEHWEEGQELSYDLIEVEQEWIDFLKPAYNTSSIAGRPPPLVRSLSRGPDRDSKKALFSLDEREARGTGKSF